MDTALLSKTAAAMVAKGKGLLAADESSGTCETRFKSVGVECTEENRRTYRGLLFTTPGVEQYLSGVILFDETIRQKTNEGVPFAEHLAKKGIIPGIKVDAGAKNLPLCPGEKVTEGLDGLPKRLQEYFKLGARFAKWRAVITIGEGIPTHTCIYANAHALARYAAACQEASIVPIIEPEVLLDGNHSAERCEEVTEATLRACYAALAAYNVAPEYTILKSSMVVSGKDNPRQARRRRGGRAHRARAQAHRSGSAARRGVPFRRTVGRGGDRASQRHGGDERPALAAHLLVFARAAKPGAQDVERAGGQHRRCAEGLLSPRPYERPGRARQVARRPRETSGLNGVV
jgi:fructose-bisphosphate aldolase class 1